MVRSVPRIVMSRRPWRWDRLRECTLICMGAGMVLGLGACTSSSPSGRAAGGVTTPAASGNTGAGQSAAAFATQGWLVPATYKQVCAYESDVCASRDMPGQIPAALKRPLHFPALRPGQDCPTTSGYPVTTPSGPDGIALGQGLIRPVIAMEGDLRHGVTDVTSADGWLGFKTDWLSFPGYQGPFVVRAKSLTGTGSVAVSFDTPPMVVPLVVPPGPTLNGGDGWRDAPGNTWVKDSGCYAWQVDGLTFSEIIVFRTGRIFPSS